VTRFATHPLVGIGHRTPSAVGFRAFGPSIGPSGRSPYDAWVPVPIFVDGEGVGFAEMRERRLGRHHCIGSVVIDARHQDNGYGKAGTQEPVACLRQRPGCEVIAPSVHAEIPARALYRSLGSSRPVRATRASS